VEEPTSGTRVDLNKVRFSLSVDHKVESQLKEPGAVFFSREDLSDAMGTRPNRLSTGAGDEVLCRQDLSTSGRIDDRIGERGASDDGTEPPSSFDLTLHEKTKGDPGSSWGRGNRSLEDPAAGLQVLRDGALEETDLVSLGAISRLEKSCSPGPQAVGEPSHIPLDFGH